MMYQVSPTPSLECWHATATILAGRDDVVACRIANCRQGNHASKSQFGYHVVNPCDANVGVALVAVFLSHDFRPRFGFPLRWSITRPRYNSKDKERQENEARPRSLVLGQTKIKMSHCLSG